MSRLNQLEREEQEAEQQEHDKIMESIENGSYRAADDDKSDNSRSTDNKNRKLSGGEDEMSVRRRQVKFRNLSCDSLSGDESDNMIRFEHTKTLVVSCFFLFPYS